MEAAVPFSLGPQILIELFLYKLRTLWTHRLRGDLPFLCLLQSFPYSEIFCKPTLQQELKAFKIQQGASVAPRWSPNTSALLPDFLSFHCTFIFASFSFGKTDYFFSCINWRIHNLSSSCHILIYCFNSLSLAFTTLPIKNENNNKMQNYLPPFLGLTSHHTLSTLSSFVSLVQK